VLCIYAIVSDMDDMAIQEPPFGDPGMTVTFTNDECGDSISYGLLPLVGNQLATNTSVQGYGTGTTIWTTPNIYTPEPAGDLEITHVVEEDEGLIGYADDGTRVLLGDWVPTAVSLRVRTLLERIAGGDELDESDLEKFCYLKRLLELQKEELENTSNRIQFIEQLIAL